MSDRDDQQRLNEAARRVREWRTARGIDSPTGRAPTPPTRPHPVLTGAVYSGDEAAVRATMGDRIMERVNDKIDLDTACGVIADLVVALRSALHTSGEARESETLEQVLALARGRKWLIDAKRRTP